MPHTPNILESVTFDQKPGIGCRENANNALMNMRYKNVLRVRAATDSDILISAKLLFALDGFRALLSYKTTQKTGFCTCTSSSWISVKFWLISISKCWQPPFPSSSSSFAYWGHHSQVFMSEKSILAYQALGRLTSS
jgi:hypothetical protein